MLFPPISPRTVADPDRRWTSLSSALWGVQLGAVGVVLFALFGMQADRSGAVRGANAGTTQPAAAPGYVAFASVSADGEQIYNTRCMSCHQMGGRGVPGTFPPLTATKWVNGDKGRLIRLLLHGLSGSIEVQGMTYSGVMPPWGGALDDGEVAQIATYIRTNFGNDASPVTTGEVARVRAATQGRTKPWTADELQAAANQGVPVAEGGGEEATGKK